jgi:hypothetical protein
MPDKFDRYREALVVETNTIWPAEHQGLDATERLRAEQALHANPKSCGQLEYVRLHTGFCRQITVTAEDLKRIRG